MCKKIIQKFKTNKLLLMFLSYLFFLLGIVYVKTLVNRTDGRPIFISFFILFYTILIYIDLVKLLKKKYLQIIISFIIVFIILVSYFISRIDIFSIIFLSILAINLLYRTYKYLSIPLYLIFYAIFLAIALGMIDKDTWQVIGLSLVCVNLILSYDFLKYNYNSKEGNKDSLYDNEVVYRFNLINLKLYMNSCVFLAYLLVLIINFLDKKCFVTRLTNSIFESNNFILIAYTRGSMFLIFFALIFIVIFLIKSSDRKAIKSFRYNIRKTYTKFICRILKIVFETNSKTIFDDEDETNLICSPTINNK